MEDTYEFSLDLNGHHFELNIIPGTGTTEGYVIVGYMDNVNNLVLGSFATQTGLSDMMPEVGMELGVSAQENLSQTIDAAFDRLNEIVDNNK